jgi:hypothetical protein
MRDDGSSERGETILLDRDAESLSSLGLEHLRSLVVELGVVERAAAATHASRLRRSDRRTRRISG